jgi:hypothetical protein
MKRLLIPLTLVFSLALAPAAHAWPPSGFGYTLTIDAQSADDGVTFSGTYGAPLGTNCTTDTTIAITRYEKIGKGRWSTSYPTDETIWTRTDGFGNYSVTAVTAPGRYAAHVWDDSDTRNCWGNSRLVRVKP